MWLFVTTDEGERRDVLERLAGMLKRPLEAVEGRLPIGPPALCAELVERYREAGVARILFWPLSDEVRQIERVALDVLPLDPIGVMVGRREDPGSTQRTRPRLITRHVSTTSSPSTATTSSCMFETPQAWSGTIRTRSPIRQAGSVTSSARSMTPCSSAAQETTTSGRSRTPTVRAPAVVLASQCLQPGIEDIATLLRMADDRGQHGQRAVVERGHAQGDLLEVVVHVVAGADVRDPRDLRGERAGRRAPSRDDR